MKISKKLAQQIVDNLKNIINQDLNFIDDDGYIIASTDSKRVDTFHQASLKCLQQNNTIVIHENDKYIGTKKGINLPVQFDGEAIGVIGISGNISEVEKFGEIIKKMTEILILEGWIKENTTKKRTTDRVILESIVNNSVHESRYMTETINNKNNYIIISSHLSNITEKNNLETILNILDLRLNDKNIIYSVLYNRVIILLHNANKTIVDSIIKLISQDINKVYKKKIRYGVSSEFTDLLDSYKHFKQAENVVEWIDAYYKELSYEHYTNMDLGILLSELDYNTISPFVNKVLGMLSEKDFEFYNALINVYGDKNGSIKKVSEALYMHKNSIQYRLDKLHELTGYNPRNLNDYTILRLAFLLVNKNR